MSEPSDNYHAHLLDGILSHLYEGIITINSTGKILSVNPALVELTGYTEQELLDHHVTLLMGDETAGRHDEYIGRFIAEGKNDVTGMQRYLPVRRKDGSSFMAEITVSRMQLNDEIIFIGSITDVTEKLEKDEKIHELARYPEENTNPVMKITADGLLCYTNAGCQQILALWQTSLNGRVPDNIKYLVNQALSNGVSQEMIVECENNLFYKLVFTPVTELGSVNVYGQDISELIKQQQELEAHRTMLEHMVNERTRETIEALMEAERANKAKSLFLANMSHEIRTPLSSIIGYSESLMDKDQTAEEKQNSIQTIIRSSHHLKDLINEILDLTKIEADRLEVDKLPVNLFSMLDDVMSLMETQARDKGIDFELAYTFPLPKLIETDPVRLKQILLNLCSNSLKFTEQGKVEIKVKYLEDSNVLEISVHDTGIGMTHEQVQSLFEPFQQADSSTSRKYGGSGLGLCLSRRLSQLLGGDIDVQSELDLGSCFNLILNLDSQPGLEFINDIVRDLDGTTNLQANNTARYQGSVLLAEDTPEIQLLIASFLRKSGLIVDLANNGKEAVERAKQQAYSVVLMDIQMPIMDGYTAIKNLRASGYDGPIIALTANAMQEDKQRCMALGCNEFLTKPIQRAQLFKALEKYLEGAPDVTNKSETLISTLYETDPDMVEMVKTFLDKFPDYLSQCKTALEAENWEAMREILHILKGMGGSYGYPSISETAREAESRLKAGDHTAAVSLFEKLLELNELAQHSYKQMAN